MQAIVKNVQLRELDKENVMISSQAYMDDVSWITDISYKLENKFTLMTNDTNTLKDKTINLNFGSHVQKIQLIYLTESVRILGAWMNLNLSKVYVFNQCKNIITGYNKIIRNKQLIDKMMRYIYNAIIIPSIEYKSQHTILNDKQVAALNILTCTLFKKRLTYIIYLQQETLSVNNVLTWWSIYLKDLKIKFNLIANTLAIIYDNNFICQSNIERKIMGGQLPITQVLNSDLLFKNRLNYHLQRHNIYFLSQIMAADRIRLLIYSDLKKQWVAFYSDKLDSSYFGHILSNDQTPMVKHWIHNINDDSISPSIQVPVLIKCTGCELKDIQSRTQSIQDAYILDSSVFEYIAMIENRVKYNTTNSQEASIRMKAYDSDDHSNVVDKLAKEACGKECLKYHTYDKDIKEIQYIEQFLMLNRNRYFTSPSDLESFDWSLTFRYIKDKFDEISAFDFRFNSFKIKLHIEELFTQDNLCK
ncbi:hypothetical protein GLOIN_2v1766738 [Rhizophagus clarus]|uniref:Reverse transcriptase domain-containing protein n=1 Tax=Rhizophagus clarus TaxID=94130 RepID=A0A8H3QG74_9GLOM|nr:hypothetical protein GLOIN_2v1766738 [Rhizophagus clarus]